MSVHLAARDPEIPRREGACRRHGTAEFALYQKANGDGSPGWRCMRCRAEASLRVYFKRRG